MRGGFLVGAVPDFGQTGMVLHSGLHLEQQRRVEWGCPHISAPGFAGRYAPNTEGRLLFGVRGLRMWPGAHPCGMQPKTQEAQPHAGGHD